MALLTDALYEHLKDDAPLVVLRSTRVHVLQAPNSAALPFTVFQRIGGEHIRHMTGGAGLTAHRYQIDSYAKTNLLADQIADATRIALDNFSGTMGTVNTAEVRGAFLENDSDDYITQVNKDEDGTHRVSQEFVIWATETVT